MLLFLTKKSTIKNSDNMIYMFLINTNGVAIFEF